MDFDLLIVGAGPGGIFSAYEAMKLNPGLKIALFETGNSLEKGKCPVDGVKIKPCINCKACAIMNGFSGAEAFSDGKCSITNQFGGTLHEHIGRRETIDLMNYVNEINVTSDGQGTKLYISENTHLKRKYMQNDLHLLEVSARHLSVDMNYIVLENLYSQLRDRTEIHFHTRIDAVEKLGNGYRLIGRGKSFTGSKYVISTGHSGSEWMGSICRSLGIATESSRVDIGVRIELPYGIFSDLTGESYENRIIYRTTKSQDKIRTFCMGPHGIVVSENTNGVVAMNGHSYENPSRYTENTNFALLVSNHFTEPSKDSGGYRESVARLSNILGGGVIIQHFGDLTRRQKNMDSRIMGSFVTPTLSTTPGDLSLVIPRRQMDGIIEMIYALDKVTPGTANDNTLLYGVEARFYNLGVEVDHNLETKHGELYAISDYSDATHSLSHTGASGVCITRHLYSNER